MQPIRQRLVLMIVCAFVVFIAAGDTFAQLRGNQEERDRYNNLIRTRSDKQDELAEQKKKAEEVKVKGGEFKDTYEEQGKLVKELGVELAGLRRSTAELNRQAAETKKRLMAELDTKPDVAAAREKFVKTDAARQRITESVLAPVHSSPEYKGKAQKLEEYKKKLKTKTDSGSAKPAEISLLHARISTTEHDMAEMDKAAIAASPEAQAAREAAEKASAEVRSVRNAYMATLLEDPAYKSTQETAANNRIAIGTKSKEQVVAKREQSSASKKMKKANGYYKKYTRAIAKLKRDIKGLDSAIASMRRKLGG